MKSEYMTISAADIPVYSTAPLYWSSDGNYSYQVAITLLSSLPSEYFTQCQQAVPVSGHSAPYWVGPKTVAQRWHS